MSSDNQRTLLSKAFEILLRYYDLAGALRCLKQRCVINSGELQAISKQPDAEDKVEMLKTVLSEDPTRTGAFISAMIAFSEEGKAELQYLLSEVESGTRNSINLGSLMEFLPSAVSKITRYRHSATSIYYVPPSNGRHFYLGL